MPKQLRSKGLLVEFLIKKPLTVNPFKNDP